MLSRIVLKNFKILNKRPFIFGIINYPHILGPQTIESGQVVAVGGRHATALPAVDIFDPALETWRVRINQNQILLS